MTMKEETFTISVQYDTKIEIIDEVEHETPLYKECVVRKPNRKIFGMIFNKMCPMDGKPQDLIGAGEIVLKTCWVSGDEDIKTKDDLITAAALQCITLIEMKNASIKKN